MTLKELERRVNQLRSSEITVLCILDGREIEMTAAEYARLHDEGRDIDFQRVVKGNNLEDVEKILDTFESCIE